MHGLLRAHSNKTTIKENLFFLKKNNNTNVSEQSGFLFRLGLNATPIRRQQEEVEGLGQSVITREDGLNVPDKKLVSSNVFKNDCERSTAKNEGYDQPSQEHVDDGIPEQQAQNNAEGHGVARAHLNERKNQSATTTFMDYDTRTAMQPG